MDGHNHSQFALNSPAIDTHIALVMPKVEEVEYAPGLPAASALGHEFCRFCGQTILADAVLCIHCGRQVKDLQAPSVVAAREPERISWHVGEMIGLIMMTVLCPLVGYVYGHIGSREHGKERQAKALMIVAAAFNILYVYAYITAHSPPQP